MNFQRWWLGLALIAALSSIPLTGMAQQAATGEETSAAAISAAGTVPQVVNYAGVLTDATGRPFTGIAGVTFFLYKDAQGGAPLWMETQNVHPDKTGHYSVMLGSTRSQGLPREVFVSGEARWLGVQAAGEEEQPRVLLVAVPYALKAADAETVGGLPASAFVLANGANQLATSTKTASSAAVVATSNTNPAVTGKGNVDFIPMWNTASDLIDSLIFQKRSNVGIGTTSPAATLDINGKGDVRDTLTLFPKGTDSTLAINGTTFTVDQTGKVTFVSGQTFPGAGTITGISTANSSGLQGGGAQGSLNLSVKSAGITNPMLQHSSLTIPVTAPLTGGGSVALGAAGTALAIKPCPANQVLLSNGTTWSCAGVGTGTITAVTAGTDLTGGGSSGSVTLNLDTTKIPLLKATNTFVGNQTITGNLSDTGNISASGSVTGQTGSFVASTPLFTNILGVTQQGGGTAISGFTSAPTGVTFAVSGLASSPSGVGVSGEGGTGILGVGYASSGGTGVSGSGKYGVQGTSSVSSGAGGVFNNTASGESLSAQINSVEVFGVYPGGTLVNGGGLIVGGNSASALVGDPGCGAGFAGIGFGGLSGCSNYSLIGDSHSTYLNRPLGGSLFFRENNGTEMVIGSGGQVGIGTTGPLNGQLDVVAANGFYAGSFDGTGPGAAGIIANGGNGGSSDGGAGGLFVGGSTSTSNAFPGDAIDSYAGDNTGNGTQSWAGYFEGNVGVNGTLEANAKNFKIDHPLDPANKYLNHTSVESSEMTNLYTGNVVLDANGEAAVQLADWFEALNRDFRYQLTCLGGFAPVYVAQEFHNGTFRIAGGRPGLKVSWQVTGVRQDAWANAHRIPVEEQKNDRERGHYLHPELYGAAEEQSIQWARHPELMKRMKEHRAKLTASAKP
jgi:hypothetical protein